MHSTPSHRADADRLIELLDRVKNDCLASLSGFRVGKPWSAEWRFSQPDQQATVTASIPRKLGETERLRLAVKLVEHKLKPLRFDVKRGHSTIQFIFPGPLRLVYGTDCAGEPTIEVRETTRIKTREQLAETFLEIRDTPRVAA